MTSRSKKFFALWLAASQLLSPLVATAATYEMHAAVPKLVVTDPASGTTSGTSGGTGSTSGAGTTGSGSTGASGGTSTGSTGGTSGSGSSGGTSGGSTGTPPSVPSAPAPYLTASLAAPDLGNVTVGSTAYAAPITITNTGNADFTFSTAPSVVGTGFAVTTTCAGTLVAGGGTCQVTIRVTPTTAGALTGGVYLTGNTAAPLVLTPHAVGVALVGQASWATPSLDFGGVALNSTSTKTATLTNVGSGVGQWSSLTGLVPGFTANASACAEVAAGASCTVLLTFSPVTAGSYSDAAVTPSGTAVNALTLTGTGLQTSVALSTGSVAFGHQAIGSVSANQGVLVTNTGNTELTVASPTVSGPFTATTDCASSLAAGSACHVNLGFAPTTGGAQSGTVSFGTGAGAQTVSVSGFADVPLTVGLSSVPSAVIAPSGSFARTHIGATTQQTIYVVPQAGNVGALAADATLSGDSAYTLVSALKVNASGIAQACGATLSSSAESGCQGDALATSGGATALALTVQFAPTGDPASHSATLTVAHNGTNTSPLTVNLSGTSYFSALTLSAQSLTFARQYVTTSSDTQSLAVVNPNEGSATVSAYTVTGPFTAATNCTSAIPGLSTCYVNVAYVPTALGTQSGSLTVVTNAGSYTVALTGFGLQPLSAALSSSYMGLAAPSGALGNVNVGATTTQTYYVKIAGNDAALQSQVSLTGDSGYSLVSVQKLWGHDVDPNGIPYTVASVLPCGATLGAQSATTCTSDDPTTGAYVDVAVTVKFTATSEGSKTALLSVANNTVSTASLSLNLSATSVGVGIATPSTSTLGFGSVNVGDTTQSQTVQLSNTGTSALTLSGVTVSGSAAFSSTTNCGSSLAMGGSCLATVKFVPTASGAASGALNFATNVGTASVSLSGTGQALTVTATLAANATSAAMTLTPVATLSLASATAVQLYSGATLSASSTAVSWTGSSLSVTLGTLPAAGSYTVKVLSGSTVIGTAAASVLNGTATLAAASGSSTNFGTVLKGGSLTETFTFTNTGTVPLAGVSAAVSGDSYTTVSATTCSGTVAVAGTCSITVQYAPSAVETLAATLSVTSTTYPTAVSVSLSGFSSTPVIALNFDGANASTTFTDSGTGGSTWTSVGSAAQSTTLFRQGSAALALNGTSQAVTGPAVNLVGDFTLSAWVRPTAAVNSAILYQWKQVAGQGGYGLGMTSAGAVTFGFGAYSESANLLTSANSVVPLNQWTHLAVTRAGSTFTLYINGASVATATSAVAGRTLAVADTIGQYYGSGGALPANLGTMTAWFPGAIDQVYINSGSAVAPTVVKSTLSSAGATLPTAVVSGIGTTGTVTVVNAATAPVNISAVTSTGSTEFAVVNANACTGTSLAAGASCDVTVSFTPTTTGTRTGTLSVVSSDASNSPLSVNLTGTASSAGVTLSYLVGGGGGAGGIGGGGGAGGVRTGSAAITQGVTYSVTVGTGGAPAYVAGVGYPRDSNGTNSSFGALTAIGGGSGGTSYTGNGGGTVAVNGTTYHGSNGGSGGGSGANSTTGGGSAPGGTGQAGQGYAGGASNGAGGSPSGGGGGAGAVGGNAGAGVGGVGIASTITGTSVYYGGGGGGGSYNLGGWAGGNGGGGAGSSGGSTASSGTANTSGGGGGNCGGGSAGSGGSGVVIISVPTNYGGTPTTTGTVTVTTVGANTVYKFTAGTGSITF